MAANVVTGIPKAPNATGVVSKISVYVSASNGSNLFFAKFLKEYKQSSFYPKDTISEEQMAPGVPKPATPNKKKKENDQPSLLYTQFLNQTFQESTKTISNNEQDDTLIWRCISQHPSTKVFKNSRVNSGVINKPILE